MNAADGACSHCVCSDGACSDCVCSDGVCSEIEGAAVLLAVSSVDIIANQSDSLICNGDKENFALLRCEGIPDFRNATASSGPET